MRSFSSEYRTVILDSQRARSALDRIVAGERVVEIGPGIWGGLVREVLGARAVSYVGFDIDPRLPFVPCDGRVEFRTGVDALTALKSEPASSAVSVSTGVLDPRMLAGGYLERLAVELARVAPCGIHWIAPDAQGPVLTALACAGLRAEPITATIYRTQSTKSPSRAQFG